MDLPILPIAVDAAVNWKRIDHIQVFSSSRFPMQLSNGSIDKCKQKAIAARIRDGMFLLVPATPFSLR